MPNHPPILIGDVHYERKICNEFCRDEREKKTCWRGALLNPFNFLLKNPLFQIPPNQVLYKIFLDKCSREITISWCLCLKSGTPVIWRDKNLASLFHLYRKEYLRAGKLASAKGVFASYRWSQSVNYDLIEFEIYESDNHWKRFVTSHETTPCFKLESVA